MSPERPSCVHQWPIRRPRRMGLLVWALALAGIFCLGYVSLYTIPVALYGLWRLKSHPHWGLLPPDGVLSINKEGEWGLSMGESFQPLSLLHAWQGMGWLTLRFARHGCAAGPEKRLELTVWKSCAAPQAWRWLCVQVVSGNTAAESTRIRTRSAA